MHLPLPLPLPLYLHSEIKKITLQSGIQEINAAFRA